MMRFIAALVAVAACAAPAAAQDFPSQTVRIVVPFTPGSVTDIMARVIAGEAGKRWPEPVIVENRPGPAGTLSVARAKADGYTLLLTANAHTIARVVNKEIGYDPIEDFVGVTRVASVPFALISSPSLEARTLSELIALARAKPGQLNNAFAGIGGSGYIAVLLFNETARVQIEPVAYKGGPQLITAVARGDSQLSFAPATLAKAMIDSGKVRALAVTTAVRSSKLPAVPTFQEAGLALTFDPWFGVLAPAGTPRAIVAKLNAEIVQIVQSPTVKAIFTDKQGFLPMTDTPEAFDKVMREEAERFGRLVRKAGGAR